MYGHFAIKGLLEKKTVLLEKTVFYPACRFFQALVKMFPNLESIAHFGFELSINS
jgi:hypothetical protein